MTSFRPLVSLALLCLGVCRVPAALLPVENFFRLPERRELSLSPSGRFIAALAPNDKKRFNILVIDRQEHKSWWVTNEEDTDVVDYFWKTDEQLIFSLGGVGKAAEDSGGLFSVRRDGRDLQVMVPSARMQVGQVTFRTIDILHRLRQDPEYILVASDSRMVGFPDVYKQRVGSQVRKMVVENPGNVVSWTVDAKGAARAGVRMEKEGLAYTVVWRPSEDSPWVELARNVTGERGWLPAGFSADGRTMYVFSNLGRSTAALYEYDPATRTFGRLLFEDPVYDAGAAMVLDSVGASGLTFNEQYEMVGLRYYADKQKTVWFAEPYKSLQAELDGALPDHVNNFSPLGVDAAHHLAVVTSSSASDPGAFYLLNAKTLEMSKLASVMSWINPGAMAEVRPISYAARDGRIIHGYLTLPRGREPKNLPLVFNPHGGPYGVRDEWRFDPMVQFLANRGYVVLQIDYRGSGGYGFDHYIAGRHQIGYAMLDDKVDAVKWAIAQGIADPRRTGVFGASYGGYAAMAGIVYYPDLFKWAIDYVGVVDFRRQIDYYRKVGDGGKLAWNFWTFMVGHPDRDREALAKISPLTFADQVRRPLFIIHGRIDPTVPIDQADALRATLDRAKIPYDYHVANDEGHGFRKEENNFKLFTLIDAFLQRVNQLDREGHVVVHDFVVLPDGKK
jgi:dipeptidyl aminopeptidase/acylaminoacyl peptidase